MNSSNKIVQSPIPAGAHHTKLYIGLILVALILFSSWFGASYYLGVLHKGSNGSNAASSNPEVNVLINYGNDTAHWYNSTRVSKDYTVYNITVGLATVNAEYYPKLHAHFVNSINGYPASGASSSSYWALWIYCPNDQAWMSSNWGSDLIKPQNNEMSIQNTLGNPIILSSNGFAWFYQDDTATDPPVAGAAKVDFCSSKI